MDLKPIERQFTALFVDSSPSCLDKLKSNLQDEIKNMAIEISASPKEAMAIIKLKPFDVIISNNEFDDFSGLELLEEIRTSGNATPFILLVKKKSESVYSKAFSLGVDDLIVREDNPSITCLEVNNAIKKIIDFSTEVQRRITDTKSIEDAYAIQTQELEKRLWESNFLYAMPKILNYLDQPQKEPFLKIIDLIKETWKTSDLLSIRINFEEIEYKTDNFKETEWKQSSDIVVSGKKIGYVEVFYQESTPAMYETVFLIEALTREISKVTERIYRNAEVRKLSRAVEQSPSVIILTDMKGRVEWVNPKFVEVTGYSVDVIIGEIPDVLKKNKLDVDQYKKIWKTITGGDVWKGELLNKKKNGVFYWAIVSISPVRDEEDNITHFIIIQEDITELKKVLEALNESEERNKAYVKAIPDLMLRLDKNGIVLDHSIPADFGISFPTRGNKISQIFKVLPQKVIDSFLNAAKKAFFSGESKPFEFSLSFERTRDNLNYYEARAVSSGLNEVLIIVRDITDKKQAEEATHLREAKEKIEVIINTMADGILVLDTEGTHFLANESFKNLYYYIFDEPVPHGWNCLSNSGHIFHDTINDLFLEKQFQAITIEPIQDFHLQLLSTQAQTPGLEGFLIITLQDITPFVKFDKMVKQFISTASHELRTPVSVIIQSLSNLQKHEKKMSDEVKSKLMDSLHRNANLMYELVDDLLLISRIDEKKIRLVYEALNPFQILQKVLVQLEPKQKSKNIKIKNNVCETLDLDGDSSRISQVFRILIDNAVKYSHDGGSVQINSLENYHGLYNPGNTDGILFEVLDEGMGIRKADQLHIFDRFFRSHEVSQLPGTGLGLSIAKEIAVLHKGDIYFESKYRKGSSFFVFLPKTKTVTVQKY